MFVPLNWFPILFLLGDSENDLFTAISVLSAAILNFGDESINQPAPNPLWHKRMELVSNGTLPFLDGPFHESFRKFWFWCLLLYRHECFTGKYTTRKFHKNNIQDPTHV